MYYEMFLKKKTGNNLTILYILGLGSLILSGLLALQYNVKQP